MSTILDTFCMMSDCFKPLLSTLYNFPTITQGNGWGIKTYLHSWFFPSNFLRKRWKRIKKGGLKVYDDRQKDEGFTPDCLSLLPAINGAAAILSGSEFKGQDIGYIHVIIENISQVIPYINTQSSLWHWKHGLNTTPTLWYWNVSIF